MKRQWKVLYTNRYQQRNAIRPYYFDIAVSRELNPSGWGSLWGL